MNKRNLYCGDTRYEKVWEQMQLLGIQDVTTERQIKNGTIVWRLPIKINYPGNKDRFIEVASFSTGYVRNQNSGYSNYQLNKRNYKDEYFKDYKTTWNDNNTDYTQEWTGKYRKFKTRTCILIPIEIDRLEYLIKYCVKNYYIKHANQVSDGCFVPKWQLENCIAGKDLENLKNARDYFKERAYEAEEQLENSKNKVNDCGHYERIRDLENKLDTIKRIANYE